MREVTPAEVAELRLRLARIFLLVFTPAVLLTCFLIAPFHGFDERAHLFRATAVADGYFMPQVGTNSRPDFEGAPSAGAPIDTGLSAFADLFPYSVILDTDRRYTAGELAGSAQFHASGRAEYAAFSNTAIYPPFLYVAPALAVGLVRAVDAPLLWWLYAARIAQAMVAIAILYWAIRLNPDTAAPILLIATTPMMFYELGTVTADALLLPLALLFATLLMRVLAGDRSGRTELATVVTGSVIAAGKIAYLPIMALLPLAAFLADGRLSRRVLRLGAGAIAAFLVWGAWALVIKGRVFGIRPGVFIDPAAQLGGILAQPSLAIGVFARSMLQQVDSLLISTFVKRIGWHDTVTFTITGAIIWVGLILSNLTVVGRTRPALFWWIALLTLFSWVLIYFLLYLQFNAVGADQIRGVQGRYFIPFAALLVAAMPRVTRMMLRPAAITRVALLWCVALASLNVLTIAGRHWTFVGL